MWYSCCVLMTFTRHIPYYPCCVCLFDVVRDFAITALSALRFGEFLLFNWDCVHRLSNSTFTFVNWLALLCEALRTVMLCNSHIDRCCHISLLHFKFSVCWPRLDRSLLLMWRYNGAVAYHCIVPLVIVTDVACSCGHIGDDVWGKQSRWYVRPGGLTWPSIAISTEFHLSFSFQSCHSLKPAKFIVLVKRG